MFSGMTRHLAFGLVALVMGVAQAVTPAAAAGETGVQEDGRFVVSPAAAKVIGDYLNRVSGRFGALAVSQDGQVAAFYICQSRLWKNCDDSSLEDSFTSIPSGKLAGPLAQQRCRGITGGDCLVLFINERWQRPFTLQQ